VYDLCVLGGGPGGWAGAVRAWDLGRKVCLVERREGLGGAAVWGGAMGKHLMQEVGKGLRKARPHLQGEAANAADASAWAEVRRRTRLAIIGRAQHLDQQLFALGQTHRFNRPALKRSEKSGTIQRWKGEASFLSPFAIKLRRSSDKEVDADEDVIEAEHFLIATGSVPRPLIKFPLDGEYIVTPQELVKACPTFPQVVVVLGGGMEGCETATVLAALGMQAVHLINESKVLLPREDQDVSAFVSDALRSDGIQVHTEASLEFAKIHRDRGLVECRLVETRWIASRDRQGQAMVRNRVPKTIWADKLVLCNGRVPNTSHLGLPVANIDVDAHGGILVDHLNRSVSARHVCAAGDVIGGGRAGGLTAIAEMQARWAVEKLFSPDGPDLRPKYRGVGSVLQVALPSPTPPPRSPASSLPPSLTPPLPSFFSSLPTTSAHRIAGREHGC
jgi:dihydrolipoamide dehydrogenase